MKEIRSRKRRSPDEVRALLARYHRREVSQARFAQSEGVGLSTLHQYLRQEEVGAGRLVEVQAAGGWLGAIGVGVDPARANGGYRICLAGDVSLEAPRGFCPKEVGQLLGLLRGATL